MYTPTQVSVGGTASVYTPIAGVLGLTEGNRAANPDLRPELTTEVEFGFEAKFLKNRLGIDASYYNKSTKDQIILATVAPETRYTSQARNIGLVNNQGVELRLWAIPVKTQNFNWEIGVTFAKNASEVKKLWDGAKEYVVYSTWCELQSGCRSTTRSIYYASSCHYTRRKDYLCFFRTSNN